MKARVSILIAVVFTLALPVAARAATYTVDSTGDQVDESHNGTCKTAVNTCTLRAAIEESNFSTGTRDEIKFAAAFDGQLADTIALGSSLPAIVDPVSVLGGDCFGEDGPDKPCAGVEGPSGGTALTVENANGVEIDGLAITGAQTAINVIDSSEGFTARLDWIGVKLDGSAGANGKGVFLDPGSDGAVIGGPDAAERNVISNSGAEGLDLEGVSDATVQGNYFGVAPDGTTTAANAKDIEVTDSTSGPGFKAEDNEIGATVEGAAEATAACDGGCNVIAARSLGSGIDLNGNGGGEAPASGPTIVHGNYVGLDAGGTAGAASTVFDILVGGADKATIGGPAAGDANYIAGGTYAIYHENGEEMEAVGNAIGFGPTGADVAPPAMAAFIFGLSMASPSVFSENSVRMEGNIGIESRFGGAEITANFFETVNTAVRTLAEPGAAGSDLIAGNVVVDAGGSAIAIENDRNEVFGNTISGSGAAGIRVNNPGPLAITTGNLIGGEAPGEENAIDNSAGPAIEIIDSSGASEESDNEVALNVGEENAGPFIDLVGNANGGIQPPPFATAIQSRATGTGAEPGATVRVFRKAKAEAGELESFLGEAVADGSGNWKVVYPASIPGGTIVAATQTNVEGGTSELSTAITATEPSSGGGTTGGGAKGEKDKKPAKGKKPGKGGKGAGGVPDTVILKGPKGTVHTTAVKFKFASNTKGAKFECKLDRKPFRACASPKRYKKLKPGKHVFKVRAVKGKKVDPTPAKRKFKIVG